MLPATFLKGQSRNYYAFLTFYKDSNTKLGPCRTSDDLRASPKSLRSSQLPARLRAIQGVSGVGAFHGFYCFLPFDVFCVFATQIWAGRPQTKSYVYA